MRGEIPVEVLLQQLDQLSTMNNDLRLMLKEARYETRLLRTEMANVHAHGKALEDSMKLVQALSEARHFEIERLGEVLRRTDAKLRAMRAEPGREGRPPLSRGAAAAATLWRVTGVSRSLTDP